MQKSSLRRPFNVYPSSFYETVVFNSRQPANQSLFTPYTIYRAKRRKIDDEERLARGLLNVKALAWLVDQAGLTYAGAPDPKSRDQFVAADGTWIIIDKGVEVKELGHVFECVCQLATGPAP